MIPLRMHEPSLIFQSPYDGHSYKKVLIHPMYMQVVEPPFFPYSSSYVPSFVPAYPVIYGSTVYTSPFYKHFPHIIKAKVWDG
ncbi:hypothetical protein ACO11K_002211 [Bacillus cytotoxicus]|uniref:hypothetical protein n=1 Tax=Bacillus cereus group sp. BfR-BA-01492 TaxID=2920361 RepID=UPI001F58DEB5|nr:hypothetical protein [Bacillus cereus group sp. BfR-BA-01492]